MSAIPGELAVLRASAPSDVVLAESGIGKVNAAAVTTKLILEHRPDVILFTGVAGGLDPSLGVGDVVIGERTIQHDAGVLVHERIDVYQAGHIPFFNPTDQLGYRPSDSLLATAREAAADIELETVLGRPPDVTVGTVLTGDQFLDDAVTRDRLFREFGAQAVEMEGAAVAQVADRFGVDCLVIRALSDLAGGSATLDFASYFPQVAANSARLVGRMLVLLAGRRIRAGGAPTPSIDEVLDAARARLDRVRPEDLGAAMQNGAVVVDVRDSAQIAEAGELPGAHRIDLTVLEWRLAHSSGSRSLDIEPGQQVILVCRQGYSSSLAAARLKELGIDGATDLIGGFEAWQAMGPGGTP